MPKSGEHRVNGIDSFFRVRPSSQNLREGENVSFLEDGKLIKQEKRNGVVYEQVFVEQNKTKQASVQTTGDVTNLIVAGSSSSEGDITGITAGTGLSGGGATGNITLNIDSTVTTLTGSQTLTNKTLTAPTFTGTAQGANLTLTGDLTVGGTTTTLNAQNLQVKDKNIVLNYLDGDASSTADGAGITIQDAVNSSTDATILWDNSSPTNSPGEFDFSHSINVTGNISVSGTVDGRDLATDGSKLDGIESSATADQTASEILTAIKTVDGATSGLDSDLLDGQHGSYYLDFGNFVIDDDEIPIAKLASDSVSYGGVSVTLGSSDATPAFDLSDATSLPIVAGTSGTLSVARGGTGATTLTNNAVLTGTGTSAITAESTLTWAGVYLDVKSNDDAEGGITLSKSSTDATHTKYSISHRDDNQSLIIYSYDGTTFRNWFTADEPSAQLKLGANSSNPLIIDDNGDLNVLHLIEHQGDTNTYIQFTNDRLRFAAGGEVLLDLFEGTQDYVKLGDGGDVDINLNDDMFVSGASGNVGINQGNKLYFDGINVDDVGQNTYIQSDSADNLRLVVGNRNMIEMIEDDSQDMVVIGNGSTDIDFIVEDDAGAAVLTVDSATSKTTLHSLDVTNNVGLGDVTADNVASNSFHYNNSGSLGAEAFTIGASGGVNFTQAIALANADFSANSSDGAVLSLKTTLTNEDAVDVLGRINFSAPVSGNAGDDSRLLAASIVAQKSATFSSTSNQTDLIFQTGTSETATEKVRIKNDGKVGIGTQSPSKNFVVKGASGDQARFEHNGAVGAVDIYSGTDGGLINVRNASGTSIIELDGRSGNLELPYGRITDAGTDMNIVSDNALTLGTESGTALTIPNASTNVGIGITSPSVELHVKDASSHAQLRIETDSASHGAYLELEGSANKYQIYNVGGDLGIDEAGQATRLTIKDSTGNVGIGANNPLRKLHVVGSMAVNEGTDQYYGILMGGGESNDPKITIGDWHNSSGSIMWDSSENVLKIDSQHSTANRDIVFTGNDFATEYMRVNATGLGIGTNSPGEKLTIKAGGDTSQEVIKIRNSSNTEILSLGIDGSGDGYLNFNSSPAVINTNGGHLALTPGGSGNVGIGTASPEGKVHIFNGDASVAPDSDGDELVVENSGDSGISILSGESNGHTGSLIFGSQNDGNGAGVVWDYYSKILNVKTQNSSGILRFASANNSEAMRIDSSQNVGIGTTDPASYNNDGDDFVIAGTGNTGMSIASGTSSNGSIMFADGTGGTAGYRGAIKYNHGSDYMHFNTAAAERMRIDSAGHVGIGTNSPSFGLQIDGSNFSGDSLKITRGTSEFYVLNANDSYGVLGMSSNHDLQIRTNATTRMTIDNSGHIGIGTTNPDSYELQFGNAGDKIGVDLSSGGTTRIAEIEFYNGSDGSLRLKTDNASSGGIEFHTEGSKRMIVARNGNVGVGNLTSPAQPFQTHGTSADTRTRTSTSNHGTYFESGVTADSAGILLVAGHASSILNIYLQGSGGTQNQFRFTHNGDFLADEDIVAYSTSVGSDRKLKDNIKDTSYGLSDVMKMRAVEFDWKEKRDKAHDIGVIAQEIEEIIPEVVKEVETLNTDGETHKVVDYAKLSSVLIKAIQEQQEQINKLEEKLNG